MRSGTGRASLLTGVLGVAIVIVGLALRFAVDTYDGSFFAMVTAICGTLVCAAAVALGIVALAQRQRPRSDAVVGLVVGALPPLIFLVAQVCAFAAMLGQPRGG